MTWSCVVVIHEGMDMQERIDTLRDVLSRDNADRRQSIRICADVDVTGKAPSETWDCRKLMAPKGFARSLSAARYGLTTYRPPGDEVSPRRADRPNQPQSRRRAGPIASLRVQQLGSDTP